MPKWKREIEQTVPGVRAAIVASISDLERLRAATGTDPLFAIMSRERAKLSYRWQPATVERWATTGGRRVRGEETAEPFRVPCCPDCHAQVVDKDGVPLLQRNLVRRKRSCGECGSPLWQADRSGPKRYPLAEYVKHRMRGFFELLIGDEIHEFKGRGSAQDRGRTSGECRQARLADATSGASRRGRHAPPASTSRAVRAANGG